MSRYAEAKPYVLPTALDELSGPTSGTVELPRHIDWGPRYVYDLGDEADVILMYERVIRESPSPADVIEFLDAATLRRLWPALFLPGPARAAWQRRFAELRHGEPDPPV